MMSQKGILQTTLTTDMHILNDLEQYSVINTGIYVT